MQKHLIAFLELLRDFDWWLGENYDRAVAFFRAHRHRVLAWRNGYAVILVVAFALIAYSAPRNYYQEDPDQPINHIYANIGHRIQSFASGLNPIGNAIAALPDFGIADRAATSDSDGLSGEGNNFGEQSLADDIAPKQKIVKLSRGDSLTRTLSRAGVATKEAQAINAAVKKIYNPQLIDVGEDIAIDFEIPEERAPGANIFPVEQIAFAPSHDKRVIVSRDSKGKFKAKFEIRPVEVRLNSISTSITGNLSSAAKKAGIPKPILSEMTRVFSYDVDFQRDIHPGDRLEVVFEEIWDEDGKFAKYGNMIFASLKYGQKELKIQRYKPTDDSRADYFDANGRAVRKALLRTPVDGARITNGFGMRRHPILGYSKMHEGVDFAAPIGTPIIAAGDGVIVQKGWNGGYGHYVEIRHNKEFATAYGHLSRYHANLQVGKRVRQGDVIGYIGSTGLSTGPHLHYEVLRGQRKINPVGVKFPTGRVLAGKELQKFKLAMADTQLKLAQSKAAKKSDKIAAR